MALKVELKPHERIIIGACVITNTDQRARLLIDGDNMPILREKDILTPETADTPAKLIYLAVQLMYISPDPQDNHGTYFNLVRDIVTAAAEHMADHRGNQQPHPERRPVSGAEGGQEARRLRARELLDQHVRPQQAAGTARRYRNGVPA